MQFPVRHQPYRFHFDLFASAALRPAAPRRAGDNDTVVTLAQNESQEVEGEEGKDGQTPATGGEEAGGGGAAMAAHTRAANRRPNSRSTRSRRRGSRRKGGSRNKAPLRFASAFPLSSLPGSSRQSNA